MPETVYTCRVCGKPNEGECRPDPDPGLAASRPAYVHPRCHAAAVERILAERALARSRLKDAAPDLLAALESILESWEVEGLLTGADVARASPPSPRQRERDPC